MEELERLIDCYEKQKQILQDSVERLQDEIGWLDKVIHDLIKVSDTIPEKRKD